MRKIPKDDLQAYLARHMSRRHSPLLRGLEELGVGEAIEFKKEDYHRRASFACTVGAGFHRTPKRFSVRTLTDGSGWVVLRIK
jgi:hypothetical protein